MAKWGRMTHLQAAWKGQCRGCGSSASRIDRASCQLVNCVITGQQRVTCCSMMLDVHQSEPGSACRLTLDEKVELALSVAEECIDPTELRNLLDKKPNPIAYDGFEPSGRMHIAQVSTCPAPQRHDMQGSTVNLFVHAQDCMHGFAESSMRRAFLYTELRPLRRGS